GGGPPGAGGKGAGADKRAVVRHPGRRQAGLPAGAAAPRHAPAGRVRRGVHQRRHPNDCAGAGGGAALAPTPACVSRPAGVERARNAGGAWEKSPMAPSRTTVWLLLLGLLIWLAGLAYPLVHGALAALLPAVAAWLPGDAAAAAVRWLVFAY